MRSNVLGRISGMMSAEGQEELSRLMLDVLRVLVVYNGTSWKSELAQELPLLRAFKGEPEPAGKMLEDALGRLQRDGLLKVEKRERAEIGGRGHVRDELVTLTDTQLTRSALAGDRVLSSYMQERITIPR
jgi:hypothetical protein